MMDYILQHDFSRLWWGRITLDGDDLFINLDEVELKPKEEQTIRVSQGLYRRTSSLAAARNDGVDCFV